MKIKGSIMTGGRILIITLFVVGCGAAWMLGRAAQAPEQQTNLPPSGDLRLVLDEQQLGSTAISIAERTWPANYESIEHSHTSIEVIYVLSGEYQHVLNGQTQVLGPGMVGVVKLGDKVRHKTGPKGPTKALLISVPGEEGRSILERFRQRAR